MKKLLTTTRVSARRDVAESMLVGTVLTSLSYIVGLLAGY